MTSSKIITKEDVIHLGKLAKLDLTQEEIEQFEKQLTATLEHVNNLNQLDTDNVEPTSHSTNLENIYFEDGEENEQLLTQNEALQNAKNTTDNYFFVKRIL